MLWLSLLLLLVAFGHVLASPAGERSVSGPDLDTLRKLSISSASREEQKLDSPSSVAARSADAAEKPQRYFSELIIRDPSRSELAPKDHVLFKWEFQFAKPDRYQVKQTAWDGQYYVVDDWITIGSEEFINILYWMKKENTRSELNELLRVDKYLPILRQEVPTSASVYRYYGHRYFVLEYETPRLGDLGKLVAALPKPGHLRIWIDSESGLPAKAELVALGVTGRGKQARFHLEQTIAGYGSDIRIETPKTAEPQ